VILATTIKANGHGEAGEDQNITHQAKNDGHDVDPLNFAIASISPLPDDTARSRAGSSSPPRTERDASTCASAVKALVRIVAGRAGAKPEVRSRLPILLRLETLPKSSERPRDVDPRWPRARAQRRMRDKKIGKFVVPIVPDESRTFGMEGMFRQLGIYSSVGQLYKPQDADQLMYYKEDKNGRSFRRASTKPGACARDRRRNCIQHARDFDDPVLHLLFDVRFQRVGDLIWAAADSRTRGFLLGWEPPGAPR
jgi:pyruvate dehydrogenase E1 component